MLTFTNKITKCSHSYPIDASISHSVRIIFPKRETAKLPTHPWQCLLRNVGKVRRRCKRKADWATPGVSTNLQPCEDIVSSLLFLLFDSPVLELHGHRFDQKAGPAVEQLEQQSVCVQ